MPTKKEEDLLLEKLENEKIDLHQKEAGVTAILNNDLDLLKDTIQQLRVKTHVQLFYETAIDCNNKEAIKTLDIKFDQGSNSPWLVHPIKKNNLHMFDYYFQRLKEEHQNNEVNSFYYIKHTAISLFKTAIRYQSEDIIQYLTQEIQEQKNVDLTAYAEIIKTCAKFGNEKLYYQWFKVLEEQTKSEPGMVFVLLKNQTLLNSVRGGNFNIIQHLVETLKVPLESALYEMAKTENKDLFRYLLRQGANINERGGRILHWAIQRQNKDFIKFLIQSGAEIGRNSAQDQHKYNKAKSLVELCKMELEWSEKKDVLPKAKQNKL